MYERTYNNNNKRMLLNGCRVRIVHGKKKQIINKFRQTHKTKR